MDYIFCKITYYYVHLAFMFNILPCEYSLSMRCAFKHYLPYYEAHFPVCSSPFAMPGVRHTADDRGEHECRDEGEQHQVDQALQSIITNTSQCLHIILNRDRDTIKPNYSIVQRFKPGHKHSQLKCSFSDVIDVKHYGCVWKLTTVQYTLYKAYYLLYIVCIVYMLHRADMVRVKLKYAILNMVYNNIQCSESLSENCLQ